MSEILSPEEAAAIAQGEDISDPMGADVGDVAAPEPAGRGSSLLEALMSTEPSAPLETIESPWNPEHGGVSRVYRGIQKMTNVDGMPAIADIVIGAAEAFVAEVDQEAEPEPAPLEVSE